MSSVEHRRRSRQLLDYATGRLTGAAALPVERHLVACPDCRSWLSTYRLLEESAPGTSLAEKHPETAELVGFALDRGPLDEETEDRIGRHLRVCAPCRRDVEQCRMGVDEARRAHAPVDASPRRESPALRALPRDWRLALAAGLAALAVGTAALYWSVDRPSLPDRLVLEDQAVGDRMVLEAADSIEVNASHVDRGGHLTLRAAQVALGDGFSVQQQAGFVVGEAVNANRPKAGSNSPTANPTGKPERSRS